MSSQTDDKKTLKSIDMKEEQFRIESDLLGELQVPSDALYGVQTQRGINNYHISRKKMRDYPDYVIAIAYVKQPQLKQITHSELLKTIFLEPLHKLVER